MRQIPVRELNQHTAEVLARVQAGEQIEVTRKGRPVAVLRPIEENPLAPLIASGLVEPASGRRPRRWQEKELPDSPLLDAVLADRRDASGG
ncbi:MAG: type II toxin-antitoxin system prevent-host-death family antitoxin [Candidatus Dormiibacterota bacterium]